MSAFTRCYNTQLHLIRLPWQELSPLQVEECLPSSEFQQLYFKDLATEITPMFQTYHGRKRSPKTWTNRMLCKYSLTPDGWKPNRKGLLCQRTMTHTGVGLYGTRNFIRRGKEEQKKVMKRKWIIKTGQKIMKTNTMSRPIISVMSPQSECIFLFLLPVTFHHLFSCHFRQMKINEVQ